MIKLQKYLNNPRNFQVEISRKASFINFQNFINKKIVESLFDLSPMLNSIINEDKNNILLLEKEQNEIDKIIKKIKEKKINGVKENEKDILEKENDNPCISDISNSTSNNNSYISTNNSGQSSTLKKNVNSLSEDEKSISLLSKETKNEKKIYIVQLNNAKLFDFINFVEQKENKFYNMKINKEKILQKIEDIINESNNDELGVNNNYLRKNACIKLYKAFSFLFKKFKLKDSKIKQFCKYIENKARRMDYEMGVLYKEYIINVLKNLTVYS